MRVCAVQQEQLLPPLVYPALALELRCVGADRAASGPRQQRRRRWCWSARRWP